MNTFEFMLPPFVECLVLVGIHSYLGLHVIKRKVIFVDLALAQIAALGITVGFLFGILPESQASFIFSMAFTFVGAAIFSLTRMRSDRIPQEAVIGLVYALAAAMAILVIEKAPHGAEHLKDIMVGSILWVKWGTILKSAIAYAFVGVFHYIFRERFFLISNDPDKAYEMGVPVRLWDFLFYMSFGFVITFSVKVAGVLLVFIFLVVPAITAILITDKVRLQLIIGWTMGTLVTVGGLFLSYVLDLPSGPTVVSFYGFMLLMAALFLFVFRARRRRAALLKLGLGTLAAAAVVALFYFGGKWLAASSLGKAPHQAHMAHAGHTGPRHHRHGPRKRKPEAAVGSRSAPAPGAAAGVKAGEPARPAAGGGAGESACPAAGGGERDPEVRLEAIRKALKTDKRQGLKRLVDFLSCRGIPFFYREQCLTLLKKLARRDFGYDPEKGPGMNRKALEAMRRWSCQPE